MKKILFIMVYMGLMTIPLFSQEKACRLQGLTMSEKVYGLSRLWSEIKYNFVYRDRLTFNYDSLYNDALMKILDSDDDYTYYRELQRFAVYMNDGHTDVFLPADLYNTYHHPIPLRTKLVEDCVFVRDVRNDTLIEKGIGKGVEILKINDQDVHDYAEENIYPFIASSTEQWRKMIAYNSNLTRGYINEPVMITFRGLDGKIFTETISRYMTEKYDLIAAYKGSPFESLMNHPKFIESVSYLDEKLKDFFYLEELAGSIMYLRISSFMGNEDFRKRFDVVYEQIKSSAGLIIDVRENIGGNSGSGEYILRHLTDQPFSGSAWSSKMYIPALYSIRKEIDWYKVEAPVIQPIQDKDVYLKPVIVLINEGTFSAAEDFCVAFRNMKRGRLVGTATGGSTGNPLQIDLPGNTYGMICTKKDTYPDGTEFVGIGIIPDIEVNETIKSFLSGKDPVLEKAIQLLKY